MVLSAEEKKKRNDAFNLVAKADEIKLSAERRLEVIQEEIEHKKLMELELEKYQGKRKRWMRELHENKDEVLNLGYDGGKPITHPARPINRFLKELYRIRVPFALRMHDQSLVNGLQKLGQEYDKLCNPKLEGDQISYDDKIRLLRALEGRARKISVEIYDLASRDGKRDFSDQEFAEKLREYIIAAGDCAALAESYSEKLKDLGYTRTLGKPEKKSVKGLAGKLTSIVAIGSLIMGVGLVSSNVTGNVIGNSTISDINVMGFSFLALGLIFGYLWVSGKGKK